MYLLHKSACIILLFILQGLTGICIANKPEALSFNVSVDQLPDSLQIELDNLATGIPQIEFLLVKVNSFELSQPPLATICAKLAFSLAEKSVLPIQKAQSQYWLASLQANQYSDTEKLEIARGDAEIAANVFEKNDEKEWLARTYDLLAAIYFNIEGELPQSEYYNNRAISITKQELDIGRNKTQLLARCYSTKAGILDKRGLDSALDWLKESNRLFEQIGDLSGIARTTLNLAMYADLLTKESYYTKAIDIYKVLDDLRGLPKAYLYYGSYWLERYKDEKKEEWYTKGMRCLDKVFKLKDEADCEILDRLGWAHHIKWGNITENENLQYLHRDSASNYYQQALKSAELEENSFCLQTLVTDISKTCQDMGNCPKVLIQMHETYQAILKSRRKLISENEEKIKKYELQQEEILSQKLLQNTILGAVALLAGIGFLYWRRRYVFLNRELEASLAVASAHKNELEATRAASRAQMNPHFISNTLGAIDAIVNFGKREKASHYLIQFSRLSRIVIKQSRFSEVSLAQEIKALEYIMSLEKLRLNDVLSYNIQVDITLNPKEISIPPMLLQPFVENAIWHGIQKKQAPGHLKVEIKRKAQKYLFCSIEDDGIGREKAKELEAQSVIERTSFGMVITQERIDAIEGAKKEIIDLKTPGGLARGTRVEILLPIKKWIDGQDDQGCFSRG